MRSRRVSSRLPQSLKSCSCSIANLSGFAFRLKGRLVSSPVGEEIRGGGEEEEEDIL